MLQITDVSRRFGDVTALSGVSLEIRQGEFFALLGPSGCGKTTLLRILAGFETPDAGTVTLDGADLLTQAAHRRPVNLMFQSYALFPHMTVAKNVAYGLERERLPKAEIRERVAEVLAKVGLAEAAGRRPDRLSGGQRQRVALARAIVKRPRLLLLDEPLSALDKKVRAEMQLELKRLQHEVGITFVVVTHDQEEAMSLADRIAVLSAGRVEQVDAPVTLYERPATPFVAGFVGANNLFTGTACAGGLTCEGVGVLAGPDGLPEGAAALLAVRPERIRLTEVAEPVAPDPGDAVESTVESVVQSTAESTAESASVSASESGDGVGEDAENGAERLSENGGDDASGTAERENASGDTGQAAQEALQDAEVVTEGQGTASADKGPDVDNTPSEATEAAGALRGRVADVSFYGGVSHVSVLVPGRDGVVLVATQGATRVQVGSSVTLTWAAEDGVLIPQ
ncbi:ATP-binding cassette domain-containing protein [Streptosporangium sp. NPDC020145]|uniref:polyamine ABC transporter ATP-binding protein n=1 Tax=Streptosporangium sp. NPDC020145 TaxID=3154694 RepID=UPI00343E66CC